MKKAEIIQSIEEELQRAEKKHPQWPDNIYKQMAIINEECGEATRACLHLEEPDVGGTIHDISDELISTAAMCIRMLMNKPLNKVIKLYDCPHCHTKTASKSGDGFECHNCDKSFNEEEPT